MKNEVLNSLFKSKDDKKKKVQKQAEIISVDKAGEKFLVYGIVLKPDVADAHGDIMTKDDIMESAHQYMRKYRFMGEHHEEFAEAVPVESFVAPQDLKMGNKTVPAGSWVVGVKVLSVELWEKIKTKQVNAFSAGGYAYRQET